MRIGIVGHAEDKFTAETEVKARETIYDIFQDAFLPIIGKKVALTSKQCLSLIRDMKSSSTLVWDESGTHMLAMMESGVPYEVGLTHEWMKIKEELTFISGRCPISICDNCGKKYFSETVDPIVGYVKCEFCGQEKKRRAGGIDIWAEEIADKLGIEKEICFPEVNRWGDVFFCKECGSEKWWPSSQEMLDEHSTLRHYPELQGRLKGFKSRNIDIAQSDEVHIIVVAEYPPNYSGMRFEMCYHCNSKDHVKSGGCWTGKYAQRLGKKAIWHVI